MPLPADFKPDSYLLAWEPDPYKGRLAVGIAIDAVSGDKDLPATRYMVVAGKPTPEFKTDDDELLDGLQEVDGLALDATLEPTRMVCAVPGEMPSLDAIDAMFWPSKLAQAALMVYHADAFNRVPSVIPWSARGRAPVDLGAARERVPTKGVVYVWFGGTLRLRSGHTQNGFDCLISEIVRVVHYRAHPHKSLPPFADFTVPMGDDWRDQIAAHLRGVYEAALPLRKVKPLPVKLRSDDDAMAAIAAKGLNASIAETEGRLAELRRLRSKLTQRIAEINGD